MAQSASPKVNSIMSDVTYTSWSLSSDNNQEYQITQFAIPLISEVYFGERGAVTFGTSRVSSTLLYKSQTDLTYNLAGFSDIKLNGSCVLGDRRGLVTLGVNLPAGISQYSSEELVVARAIAEDALNFPTSLYGTGLEYNAGIYLAGELGDVTWGGGANYYVRNKFQPFKDSTKIDLDVGDELTFSFGVDKNVDYAEFSIDAFYTIRGEDKLDDVTIYDPGKKFTLLLTSEIKYPPGLDFDIQLWVANRWRYESKLYPLSDPYSPVIRDRVNDSPHQLEIGSRFEHPLRSHLFCWGSLLYKIFRRDKDKFKGANVMGIGGGLFIRGHRLGVIPWLDAELGIKYHWGELYSSGREFSIKGLQILATINCSL